MDKKTKIVFSVIAVAVLLTVVIGNAVNLWNIGFNAGSLVGFIAIVPAVIWVLLKGVNYINSAVYFAGIGYIMYKNVFGELSARFIILCVFLALMALAFAATFSLFAVKDENVQKGKDELNG